ncbi:hypothetical protein [Kitasatospora cheerisanensis]|uniref:hypothetical protein n=1 Tax=Kitasatospora cheerisanensis TaxID=81942 RepID=UPI003CC5E164
MQENRAFDHYFGTCPACAASATRGGAAAASTAARCSTSRPVPGRGLPAAVPDERRPHQRLPAGCAGLRLRRLDERLETTAGRTAR